MIRLANMPMPHATITVHSVLDMFRVNNTLKGVQCATRDAEEIHKLVAASKIQDSSISPADWNDLFVAVQTRLENCVNNTFNHESVQPLHAQKSMVKKVVLECVEDLRHLHNSLPLGHHSQQHC